MATRKIQVRLSVSFQELVQADSGLPFKQPVNEHFSNENQPVFPLGSTQDTGSTTTVIAASGTLVLSTALIAPHALDYFYSTADGPYTVQAGAADVVPVNSIYVKDGPLAGGISSIAITNPGTVPINFTYIMTGH